MIEDNLEEGRPVFEGVTERCKFRAFLGPVHKRISDHPNEQRRLRAGTRLAVVGPLACGRRVVHTSLATNVLP